MSYLKHFWNSKSHAMRGIRYALRNESNFRLQLGVALLVLIAMGVLGTSVLESIVLLLLIVAVLILELFNTAIEVLADVVKPRLHEQVKVVKDIAAGMVLLVSVAAAVVGIVIFYPYLLGIVG